MRTALITSLGHIFISFGIFTVSDLSRGILGKQKLSMMFTAFKSSSKRFNSSSR